ncbi:minor capsid protein [Clostridium sp.]|uniref:minor capsid protein n=1 Tax=Clostridium sp. TaxID=1506 RepID=UPI003216BFD0
MTTNIKIDIDDTQKILLKRHLNKNGAAQVKFTKECAKYMNPYVPYKFGGLKDMMVTVERDKIIFNAPYAAKQYYTNKGNGRGGTSNGGKRGKFWDRRMWVSNGDKIVKSIAEFCGGRSR